MTPTTPMGQWRPALRWTLLGWVLLMAAAGVVVFALLLASAGTPVPLAVPLVTLFALLFLTNCVFFATASVGYSAICTQSRRRRRGGEPGLPPVRPQPGEPRTVIVVPIYNEDVQRVAAGILATHRSLGEVGGDRLFDFFILSDTRDPDIWLQEEQQWLWLREQIGDRANVYYRRRLKNERRKSGNIADFCRRWGGRYDYMIIFDADSVMDGRTLVQMRRRMDADQSLGILQAPPAPVNRHSLFARLQQFAVSAYGPLFSAGLSAWAGYDGNYFGHNAIIRLDAFARHCGLPDLPGREPFGGEILSHDFVEAALMRRAGYKVVIAHDLTGSYEECPTTLIDFARRDQRWCQGNLQHLMIVGAEGLHPISRLHMVLGAGAYLTSPALLAFIVLGLVAAAVQAQPSAMTGQLPAATPIGLGLLAATAVMLLIPKMLALLALWDDPVRLRAHGGRGRASLGVFVEVVLLLLVSPMMMLSHTHFVLAALLGHKVQWSAQNREDTRTTWREAIDAHGWQMIVGVLLMIAAWHSARDLFWWLTPIWLGLLLAVPLSVVLSSVSLGKRLRKLGVLRTEEEGKDPAVLRSLRQIHRDLETLEEADRRDPLVRLLEEPQLLQAHLDVLEATGEHPRQQADLSRLQRVALFGGPDYLDREDRLRLLVNPTALQWLAKRWPRLGAHPPRQTAASAASPVPVPAVGVTVPAR